MDYECHLLLTIAFVSLSYLFLVIINKSQNYTDSIMNEFTNIRIKWKTIANNKETLTYMNERAYNACNLLSSDNYI